MKKFTFAKYKGDNIVLLTKQWATAWIANKITVTGLVRPIDHYVFEQDIDEVIKPVKIKESEFERLSIYNDDFVRYYKSLKLKQ